MKRFIEGENRAQSVLFPERLDAYIGEDNPVRVIDVFVDELDLGEVGFDGVLPEATGRLSPIVAYNVQTAIDTQHHLIVAHEVTNVGNDRKASSPMAEKAREAMGVKRLTAIADRGYYSSEQILKCQEQENHSLCSQEPHVG